MSVPNPSNRQTKVAPEKEILKKYPRLTAHLICESLGYFTPKAAVNAIARHRENEPFFCEWYSHQAMCMKKDSFERETIKEIGRNIIRYAFRNRHNHKGYMADYQRAKALVNRAIEKNIHPELASWF